jgi:hypothetical protein
MVFLVWIVLTVGVEIYKNGMKLDRSFLQQTRTSLLVFVLTVVATLINPFGIGIYTETFRYVGNPMQKYISEWEPIPPLSGFWWQHIGMGVVLLFGILGLHFTGKFREKIPFILLACAFFVLALWARRYA